MFRSSETPQPPPAPTYAPFPVPPPRTGISKAAVIASVIVAVVIVGGLGSYWYSAQAAGNVEMVCGSVSTSLGGGLIPTSFTISLTVGVENPSLLTVKADWRISWTYGGIGKRDTASFTMEPGQTAYADFSFTYSAAELLAIGASGGQTGTMRLDQTYSVLVYTFQRSVSVSSGTNAGGASLPEC